MPGSSWYVRCYLFSLIVSKDKGRKYAQTYFREHGEIVPVAQLVRELASIMQEFTQSGYASFCSLVVNCCSGVRPFGVSLLVAGADEQGYHLYQVGTRLGVLFSLYRDRWIRRARTGDGRHRRSVSTWRARRHSSRSATRRSWKLRMPSPPRYAR